MVFNSQNILYNSLVDSRTKKYSFEGVGRDVLVSPWDLYFSPSMSRTLMDRRSFTDLQWVAHLTAKVRRAFTGFPWKVDFVKVYSELIFFRQSIFHKCSMDIIYLQKFFIEKIGYILGLPHGLQLRSKIFRMGGNQF